MIRTIFEYLLSRKSRSELSHTRDAFTDFVSAELAYSQVVVQESILRIGLLVLGALAFAAIFFALLATTLISAVLIIPELFPVVETWMAFIGVVIVCSALIASVAFFARREFRFLQAVLKEYVHHWSLGS